MMDFIDLPIWDNDHRFGSAYPKIEIKSKNGWILKAEQDLENLEAVIQKVIETELYAVKHKFSILNGAVRELKFTSRYGYLMTYHLAVSIANHAPRIDVYSHGILTEVKRHTIPKNALHGYTACMFCGEPVLNYQKWLDNRNCCNPCIESVRKAEEMMGTIRE